MEHFLGSESHEQDRVIYACTRLAYKGLHGSRVVVAMMPTGPQKSFSLAALLVFIGQAFAEEPSVCYGTTSNGSLQNAWKLPLNGDNFTAYSASARLIGRAYVHSTVHDIVLAAYAALGDSAPGNVFVYGETGFRRGGQFKPHKTHQNGLSVDFMVPVRDAQGRSVPLPTSIFEKWGYDLEFDDSGRLGELRIDADSLAEHIYQLDIAAKERGVGIWRVIFDPALQPILHNTPRWPYLSKHVKFSTKASWVRHDEHYHVDFEVPCEPAP